MKKNFEMLIHIFSLHLNGRFGQNGVSNRRQPVIGATQTSIYGSYRVLKCMEVETFVLIGQFGQPGHS